MKRMKICLLLLAVLLLSCACTSGQEPEQTTAPPTTVPTVDIGGTVLEYDVTALDLTTMAYDLDLLVAAADELSQVTEIRLGETQLRAEGFRKLSDAYPNARIDYSLRWLDQELTKDTTSVNFSAMTPEQTDELLDLLPLLPALEQISFVDEEGNCAFGVENLDQLDKVRIARPELYLQVSFDLFGQKVTSEDERIEYYVVEIGNEGAEVVRQVLPYLRNCTYFLMDGCGIDYEILAQMREDFPETEIVWRVWLVEEDYNSKLFLRCGSYLTDTHRIRTTYVNDENSHVLNYCTKTKYVDVGHVWQLTQCDFLSYMPDLEVCIIAITFITDITPLANHEKLEYLELFTTDIEDISPLTTCPNIEHLNLSNMPKLDDVTPVLALKKLKRIRIVDSPLVSDEEKRMLEEALPDCKHLNWGHWSTAWGWRYIGGGKDNPDPRYALLCQQMEYEIDAWEYGIP